MSRRWSVGRSVVGLRARDGACGHAAQAAFRWRLLAIILTALFFEKGNYWGLVAAAIGITHLLNDPAGNRRRLIAAAHGIVRRAQAPGAARALLLDRFIVAAALVFCLVLYLYHRGPTSIVLFGHVVRLYPPENLVTVTYAILYARFALCWRNRRRVWDAALGEAGRALFYWHLAPVLISFLLPRRPLFGLSAPPRRALLACLCRRIQRHAVGRGADAPAVHGWALAAEKFFAGRPRGIRARWWDSRAW
jgi:hypothetical protein